MKHIRMLFLCITLVIIPLTACANAEKPLAAAELLNLGEKYLLEMDYEQALVYFTKLIEIEPMNPRGYTGAAEVYIAMNELANAEAVLRQGLEAIPESAEIRVLLDALSLKEPASTPSPDVTAETEKPVVEPTTMLGVEPDATAGVADSQEPITGGDVEPIENLEDNIIMQEPMASSTPISALAQHQPIDGYITIKGEQYSILLTKLDLSARRLYNDDIIPLQYMTNLTDLQLDGNQITDITSLSNLTSLTRLHIQSNPISNLEPIANLTNLERLYLYGNEVTDISALSGLASLSFLTLWFNQIEDITPLSGLTNLQYVNLMHNPITDWSPVSHVKDVAGRPKL